MDQGPAKSGRIWASGKEGFLGRFRLNLLGASKTSLETSSEKLEMCFSDLKVLAQPFWRQGSRWKRARRTFILVTDRSKVRGWDCVIFIGATLGKDFESRHNTERPEKRQRRIGPAKPPERGVWERLRSLWLLSMRDLHRGHPWPSPRPPFELSISMAVSGCHGVTWMSSSFGKIAGTHPLLAFLLGQLENT